MPPAPDRPRKPSGPARGGQPVPQPSPMPFPKPVQKLPALQNVAPVQAVLTPEFEEKSERVLRISQPIWWGLILTVGILLIASFEFGFSTGERRIARLRSEIEAQLASAKPLISHSTPSEVQPAPQETPIASKVPPRESDSLPARLPGKTSPATDSTPARSKREELVKKTEPAKPAESTVALKFETDILPVFQAKCISCHGSLSKKGGLDLRSLASVVRGGNSGPGLKPGQPDDSPVWQTVKAGQMPPANKPQLSAEEKRLVVAWIAGGAR